MSEKDWIVLFLENKMYTALFIANFIVLPWIPISFWITYKTKALLHPGFYFGAIWFFASISYFIINTFDNHYNAINIECINELNAFVLLTAIFFILLKNFNKRIVLKSTSYWEINRAVPIFIILSLLAFFASIIDFIVSGASFDFAYNRDLMVEAQTVIFETGTQSFHMTILGIFISTNLILGIFAGKKIADKLNTSPKLLNLNLYLFLPFITQLILMLSIGGRVDFMNILRSYLFGAAITFANGIPRYIHKKLILIGIFLTIVFICYSNINYSSRIIDSKQTINWDEKPILKPFSSIIEYLSCPYMGYQLRRDDYVSSVHEYGIKTFSGILFIDFPFAATIGIKKSSIGDYLGFEKYTMKEMFLELLKKNALFASTVSSIYLLLYDDFGFLGTIAITFLFVILTQYFYIQWFKKRHYSFLSIYFSYIFFILWFNSISDPVFATGTIKTILFNVIFLQLMVFLYKSMIARFEKTTPS